MDNEDDVLMVLVGERHEVTRMSNWRLAYALQGQQLSLSRSQIQQTLF
jgi:hypothetical protein